MDDFRGPSHFRKCPYRMLLYTVLGAAYPNLWGYLMFFCPPLTSPSTRWMWYASAKSGASILAWDMSEMDINAWVGILLPRPGGPDIGETSTKYHPGPVVTLRGYCARMCQMLLKAVALSTGDVYSHPWNIQILSEKPRVSIIGMGSIRFQGPRYCKLKMWGKVCHIQHLKQTISPTNMRIRQRMVDVCVLVYEMMLYIYWQQPP